MKLTCLIDWSSSARFWSSRVVAAIWGFIFPVKVWDLRSAFGFEFRVAAASGSVSIKLGWSSVLIGDIFGAFVESRVWMNEAV